jgi:Secretion system C-terminal sorting domain
VPLVEPAGVKGQFYVGWEQTSSAVIAVGLDKNTDSGDRIYSNINGTWQQNVALKGSLMIRPVFGKGNGGPITEIEKNQSLSVYPNPSHGIFYTSAFVEDAILYDLSGRKVAIDVERSPESTKITLHNSAAGLYVLRCFQNNRWVNTKVIVR